MEYTHTIAQDQSDYICHYPPHKNLHIIPPLYLQMKPAMLDNYVVDTLKEMMGRKLVCWEIRRKKFPENISWSVNGESKQDYKVP
jgi:hypothetical protein